MLINCQNCNKEFKIKESRIKRTNIICCSMKCRTELYKNFPEKNPSFRNRNIEEKFFDEKLTRIKMGAKRRNIKIDNNLLGKDLYNIWISQNKRCYYSNILMSIDFNKDKLTSVSIDRKNPKKGYIKNNIVLCCYGLNSFKFNLTEQETFKFLDLIKENYGS